MSHNVIFEPRKLLCLAQLSDEFDEDELHFMVKYGSFVKDRT